MQQKKLIFILSIIGLVFLSSSAFAGQDGDYTYTMSGGNATITETPIKGKVINVTAFNFPSELWWPFSILVCTDDIFLRQWSHDLQL